MIGFSFFSDSHSSSSFHIMNEAFLSARHISPRPALECAVSTYRPQDQITRGQKKKKKKANGGLEMWRLHLSGHKGQPAVWNFYSWYPFLLSPIRTLDTFSFPLCGTRTAAYRSKALWMVPGEDKVYKLLLLQRAIEPVGVVGHWE